MKYHHKGNVLIYEYNTSLKIKKIRLKIFNQSHAYKIKVIMSENFYYEEF